MSEMGEVCSRCPHTRMDHDYNMGQCTKTGCTCQAFLRQGVGPVCSCGHHASHHNGATTCRMCSCRMFDEVRLNKPPPLDRDRFLERIAVALEKIAAASPTPIPPLPSGLYVADKLHDNGLGGPAVNPSLRTQRPRANKNGDKCAGCDAVVVDEGLTHLPGCTGNH